MYLVPLNYALTVKMKNITLCVFYHDRFFKKRSHLLAIVNNVAMNIGFSSFIILDLYLGMRFVDKISFSD